MLGIRSLRRLMISSSGFTLLEVMVATSILTLASGLVGTTVFQVFNASRFWQNDLVSNKELRHAGSWLAGDALNSETTNLMDGAAAASSVTLTTFTGKEITYSVVGSDLVRTVVVGGSTVAQNKVATEVVTASFALAGEDLTFSLTVTVDQGSTETILLNTHLR